MWIVQRWRMFAFASLCCVSVGGSFPAAANGRSDSDIETVAGLLVLVADADEATARECLRQLAEKVQNRELGDDRRKALRDQLRELLEGRMAKGAADGLYSDAAVLAAALGHPRGTTATRELARDPKRPADERQRALAALMFVGDDGAIDVADAALGDQSAGTREFRAAVLATFGRSESPRVADVVLARYKQFDPELQPKAVELLTQRTAWSKKLLEAIGRQVVPASALNANQVAKLMASRDTELQELVRAKWGAIRSERNPQREQVIAQVRERLRNEPGDAFAGHAVFRRVCGQCHKIYGEGQDVGPDITSNGRASLEQLLSNVLDPSLVIGASYQARTLITADGRVLTGLLVEDSPQRVVLKLQGGKLETVVRDEIDELRVSQLSLMPEGLETQLQPKELIDLFAFLVLDKPPQDPTARRIPTK